MYQDSFRSDISFLRYYAETEKVSNFCSIFRSCDLDLFLQTSISIGFLLSPSGMYQVSCRSDISFLRYRAEMKKVSIYFSIFRSCDLDLCSTNLNINRPPPLTIRHVCTKIHLDPTFHS